jgi:hypothetical protein
MLTQALVTVPARYAELDPARLPVTQYVQDILAQPAAYLAHALTLPDAVRPGIAHVPFSAQAVVRLIRSQVARLQYHTAQLGNAPAEGFPGSGFPADGVRIITVRAYPAYALALLHVARQRPALVAIGAPAEMSFQGAQPFRFEHDTAQSGDPPAEVLPGSRRVPLRADRADTLTLLNTARPRLALMPFHAPAATGLVLSQVASLKHCPAQLSDPLAEVLPGSCRIVLCADRADAVTYCVVRRWSALVPFSTQAAVRFLVSQPA